VYTSQNENRPTEAPFGWRISLLSNTVACKTISVVHSTSETIVNKFLKQRYMYRSEEMRYIVIREIETANSRTEKQGVLVPS
jgi:hypothetical protein